MQQCDVNGAWLDVEHGECDRCGTERRLYQPVDAATGKTTFELHVCAQCTQVLCKSTLSMKSRDVLDDAMENLEREVVALSEAPLRQPAKRAERLATIAALAR